MERPPLKRVVEALLFASERPLNDREIHGWLPDESPAAIREAFQILQAEYDSMGRSFVLKEVAQGFQFRTLPEFAPFVLRMANTSPARLSRAAMETLAIIAYQQPILRHEIEKIRGVDAGES